MKKASYKIKIEKVYTDKRDMCFSVGMVIRQNGTRTRIISVFFNIQYCKKNIVSSNKDIIGKQKPMEQLNIEN